MLGYPPTLGVFKRLAHSTTLTNPREVPVEAGTGHPLQDEDINVVESEEYAGGTILSRVRVIITMAETRFRIDDVGEWEVSTTNSVYPPKEDTKMLCRVVSKLTKGSSANAVEIGCGSGLVSMVLKSLGWEVTAYDVNPYAVACTRGNMDANGLSGKDSIYEAEFGEDFPIPEEVDLIVWNLPYLEEDVNNSGVLEMIEDVALTDLPHGGWGRMLLDNLEGASNKFAENVVVILVMRTEPEGSSKVLDWEERGWSWRSLGMERYGSEKVETIGFWRTGSGTKVTTLDSCKSTMDEAKSLPGKGWHRVLSRSQTNGRGRRKSDWISKEGGLFATWSLSAELLENMSPGLIQTSAGAVVSEVLSSSMKWPNDIVNRDGVKMGGVLVESTNDGAIRVGVGVNKTSFEQNGIIGSGWDETLGEIDSSEVFQRIDGGLSALFENKEMIEMPDIDFYSRISWKALSRFLSRGVLVSRGKEIYRPTGLSLDGELEVVGTENVVNLHDLEGIRWFVSKS